LKRDPTCGKKMRYRDTKSEAQLTRNKQKVTQQQNIMEIHDKKHEKKYISPKNNNNKSGGGDGGVDELMAAREGHALAQVARGMLGNARKGGRQCGGAEEGYALPMAHHALMRVGRMVTQLKAERWSDASLGVALEICTNENIKFLTQTN
jgi:hypothetical protein